MFEATISVADTDSLLTLFGACDQHLKQLRSALPVEISARDGKIHVRGDEESVTQATEVLEYLQSKVARTGSLDTLQVSQVIARVRSDPESLEASPIDVHEATRVIQPRTSGQTKYVEAMRKNDVTFAIGPAGTGKTYLAVAMAVEALKNQQVRKIVLVRPAVEAGESLGFLPGDLYAKINPYLRPLLDALREMMDHEQMKRYMEEDVIEVVPLAYMRGRTLNEAFIILDEAQNTTTGQMKMFLTRMGFSSKIVVSGDVTQVDLPAHTRSGLTDAMARLGNIEGIGRVQLTTSDIVRHRLVNEIVRAYEQGAKKRR
jgi:phosphate starvation-inducible PhoH-like protein